MPLCVRRGGVCSRVEASRTCSKVVGCAYQLDVRLSTHLLACSPPCIDPARRTSIRPDSNPERAQLADPTQAARFSSDPHGDTMTTVRFRYGFHPEGMDPLFVLRNGVRTLPGSPPSVALAAGAPAEVVPRGGVPLTVATSTRPRRMRALLLTAAAVAGAAIGAYVLAIAPSGPSHEGNEPMLAWAPPLALEPDPLPSPDVSEPVSVSQPVVRAESRVSQPATPSRETPVVAPTSLPTTEPAPPTPPPAAPTQPVTASPGESSKFPTLAVPERSRGHVTPVKPSAVPGLSPIDLVRRDANDGAGASAPESVEKPRTPTIERLPSSQAKPRLNLPRPSR